MNVRRAHADDAPDIARVHVAAWRRAYAGTMPTAILEALSVTQHEERWRRALDRTDERSFLVAELAGRVEGFAVCGASRDADAAPQTAELHALNVDPGHWRRGVGHALYSRVMEIGRQAGWRAISLWVLAENQRAQAFYAALGFKPDGTEKTDTKLTGAPLHELRYVQSLADARA